MAANEAIRQRGQVLVGAGILIIGLILLTVRISGVSFEGWWAFWPLIVIGAGVARLSDRERDREGASGVTIVLTGIWLLVNSLGLFGATWGESWPLLLVLLGLGWLVFPRGHRRSFGLLLLGVGVWFTLRNYGLADVDLDRWWPVLIILLGLSIVWRAFSTKPLVEAHVYRVEAKQDDAT